MGKVYRVAKSQTQLKRLTKHTQRERGFPCGPVIKNSPTNPGDVDSIPGGADSLEKEMTTHSSIPAWGNPWREKPGRLQSLSMTEHTHTTHTEKWGNVLFIIATQSYILKTT